MKVSEYPGSLHNHTQYSNLRLSDCIIRENDLIDYAIELGHSVVAITDHESLSCHIKVIEYYEQIKKDNPNFKIILGNEIYLCRDGLNASNFNKEYDRYFHFILLAKDEIGHKQIRELSTRAWRRSYKSGLMRRVPTYYKDLQDIIQSNPGHVIGSTACLGGCLPTQLLRYADTEDQMLYNSILSWCDRMISIFGKEDFYFELQPNKSKEQIMANKMIIDLAKLKNIKYIITTDSHYLKKEDAAIHKAFLTSQESDKGDREVDAFYATTYMMNTEELESLLMLTKEEIEKAYETIIEIKNKCKDYDLRKPLKIPNLLWRECVNATEDERLFYLSKMPELLNFIKSPHLSDRYLVNAVIAGIKKHPDLQNEEAYIELNDTLSKTWVSSEVNKARWSAYYLNLQKNIDECWNAGTIVGPGRGSAGGFVLLYCLDVIQINKLREKTPMFSWRFLNPSRVSVLDIDTDIESSKREQVLNRFREVYGEDRVANIATFKTETTKSAILTAARGLGIAVEDAHYISSLIPEDRGQIRSLHECYYGNKDKGYSPVKQFVYAMDHQFNQLWQVAQKIEGLVNNSGLHAGGIIFVDEPFENSTALMRSPDGTICTQFDLHDAEKASLIKIDLLSVEAMDKIHITLDLLCDYGYVEREPTLRETYEKVLGVYNLERDDKDMWQMIIDHKVLSLFQMEEQSGIQGISLIKPKSIAELTVLNSVIRLMASEKGAEQPLNTWARYRADISQWYKEMKDYGLTKEQIEWLAHHSAITDGVCESQEGLMSLVQEERLGGNDLTFADMTRKAIAKKQGKLFEECEKKYFENAEARGCDTKLVHYVWDKLFALQRGYSFNASHTAAYSLVALQEMNLAFKYPVIFWNTACLIVNSGSLEDNSEEEIVDIYAPEEDDIENGVEFEDLPDRSGKKRKTASTDYAKLAKAIGQIRESGISISLVDINKSGLIFSPDVENNEIRYGLKGLGNVNDDLVKEIIANRPYTSMMDFYYKIKPKAQAMISLIKSGAFDSFNSRQFNMVEFLWRRCKQKTQLTLANIPMLASYNLLPLEDDKIGKAYKIYNFNKYLKANCKYANIYYRLPAEVISFIDSIIEISSFVSQDNNNNYLIKVSTWEKIYNSEMNVLRNLLSNNKQAMLQQLNDAIFKEAWDKYAKGNISSWEMDSLCFYYNEHELKHVNYYKYGLSNFNDLPEEPVVDKVWTTKDGKTVPLYKINKICGTCISKNKNKSLIYLLTTDGIATVKFPKEYFSIFDKQISIKLENGKKKTIEKSWFNRGNKLVIQGIRRGETFIPKKYAYMGASAHQLYHIDEVLANGDIIIRSERYKGDNEDEA